MRFLLFGTRNSWNLPSEAVSEGRCRTHAAARFHYTSVDIPEVTSAQLLTPNDMSGMNQSELQLLLLSKEVRVVRPFNYAACMLTDRPDPPAGPIDIPSFHPLTPLATSNIRAASSEGNVVTRISGTHSRQKEFIPGMSRLAYLQCRAVS